METTLQEHTFQEVASPAAVSEAGFQGVRHTQVFLGTLVGRILPSQVASFSRLAFGSSLLGAGRLIWPRAPAAGLSFYSSESSSHLTVSPPCGHTGPALSALFHRVTKFMIADGRPRARVNSPPGDLTPSQGKRPKDSRCVSPGAWET